MTQILKFLNFQQLLKRVLRASSCLGGAIAILWVRPLYFPALQLLWTAAIYYWHDQWILLLISGSFQNTYITRSNMCIFQNHTQWQQVQRSIII